MAIEQQPDTGSGQKVVAPVVIRPNLFTWFFSCLVMTATNGLLFAAITIFTNDIAKHPQFLIIDALLGIGYCIVVPIPLSALTLLFWLRLLAGPKPMLEIDEDGVTVNMFGYWPRDIVWTNLSMVFIREEVYRGSHTFEISFCARYPDLVQQHFLWLKNLLSFLPIYMDNEFIDVRLNFMNMGCGRMGMIRKLDLIIAYMRQKNIDVHTYFREAT